MNPIAEMVTEILRPPTAEEMEKIRLEKKRFHRNSIILFIVLFLLLGLMAAAFFYAGRLSNDWW